LKLSKTFWAISSSGRVFARSDPLQRNQAHFIADLRELYRLVSYSGILLGLTCALGYCGLFKRSLAWRPIILLPIASREYLLFMNYQYFDEALEELDESGY
jgi:hypothetical protein